MTVTPTGLRQDLYRILDQILETGTPVVVVRKGRRLRIVPEQQRGRLESLVPHDLIVGDPEDIVHVDWSEYWNAEGSE